MSQMPAGYFALNRCDNENPHEHHMHGGEDPGTRPMYCLGLTITEAWNVARIEGLLAAHAYKASGLRGVSSCSCGEKFGGMPHLYRTHVAEVLAAALAPADGER